MKNRQQSFFNKARPQTLRWWIENQLVYGGSMNYRKVERPFDSKKLIHAVFKAKLGHAIWFTRSEKSILKLINDVSLRYSLKIKSYSIQKDHIHLLVHPIGAVSPQMAKENFHNFLRLFSAEMGRKYKEIYRKWGIKKSRNLWIYRPFTRLIS